jgi:hypothetical protein
VPGAAATGTLRITTTLKVADCPAVPPENVNVKSAMGAAAVRPATGAGDACTSAESGVAAGAGWVTANVWPAIVSDPVRAAPVFAAAEYPALPFPLPELPCTTVIQAALLTAVHAQPAGAVTVTVPAEPAAGTVALAGDIV